MFLIESPALAAGTKTESWRSSRADCVSDRINSEKERKRSEDEERRKKAIPLVIKGENKISVSCFIIPELYMDTRGRDQHLHIYIFNNYI